MWLSLCASWATAVSPLQQLFFDFLVQHLMCCMLRHTACMVAALDLLCNKGLSSRAAACLSSMLREQDAYAAGCGCGCGLYLRLTHLTLACSDCRVAAVTMQMRCWTLSNACCKKVRLHS